MSRDARYDVVGVGWSFPPRFDRTSGTVEMVAGEDEIVESLRILFGTQVGERALEPKYGCELATAVFRSATLSERTVLERTLKRAILHFEPRIQLETIAVDVDDAVDGILRIRLQYVISATNSRRNIVFPYFVEEGSLVPGW